MPAKLAVIGDSLAQGFQDGAIGPERPLWSFPAIIARALGLSVGAGAGHEFRVPIIPGDGLPLDIVALLDDVRRVTAGPDISLLEWPAKVIPEIARYFDKVEDFYEVGPGKAPVNFSGVYHNLAAHGLTVHDSGNLNSRVCDEIIAEQEGWFRDDLFGTPSGAKYRAAKMVIDPNGRRPHATQLDNLDYLVNGNAELGIEAEPPDALIVWLGANDCLGTVVELEVRDMADDELPDLSVPGRRAYNLSSASQFGRDYRALAQRIDGILRGRDIPVFVGNVPDVSIPPIARGLGRVEHDVFPYYVRFFVTGVNGQPPPFHKFLRGAEVASVQERIDAFNAEIATVVGARANWHLVDMAGVLEQLAVRRQRKDHEPAAPLREYYRAQGRLDHPLLSLDPVPSLLMLTTSADGRRIGGGLTGLDGVHPSTIGYGIAAEVFLAAMHDAGIAGADPRKVDWPTLIDRDRLVRLGPAVWDDFRKAATDHSLIWDLAFRTLGSRV